jgi:hypothetical protein
MSTNEGAVSTSNEAPSERAHRIATLSQESAIFAKDGKIDSSEEILLRPEGNGQSDDTISAKGADLDEVFSAYVKRVRRQNEEGKRIPPLVIHLHGGLVPRRAALEAADRLTTDAYGATSFPLFIVWETGLPFVLRNVLPDLVQDSLFQVLAQQVGDRVRNLLGGRKSGERTAGENLLAAAQQPVPGFTEAAAARGAFGVRAAVGLQPEGLRSLESPDFPDVGDGPASAPHTPPPSSQPDGATVDRTSDLEELEREIERSLFTSADLNLEAQRLAGAAAAQGVATQGGADGERSAVSTDAVGAGSQPFGNPEAAIGYIDPAVLRQAARGAGRQDGGERAALSLAALGAAVLGRLAAGGARVALKTFRRFQSGRDHGFRATLVEEILREFYLGRIGAMAWEKIKADARMAFDDDTAGAVGDAVLGRIASLPSLLGEELADRVRIVLVGHSAGAIFLCRMLRDAARILPASRGFEVILLAPACDFGLLSRTLEEAGRHIRRLRIFAMEDALERAEHLLDLPDLPAAAALKGLYPGSLLYFVSGLLESEPDMPLVGMQRYTLSVPAYRHREEIQAVMDWMSTTGRGTWIWAKTTEDASNGARTAALRHGDFDNEATTLQSLAHLVRNGF